VDGSGTAEPLGLANGLFGALGPDLGAAPANPGGAPIPEAAVETTVPRP
jgi:hypothetical protein